jgi:uncharacterized protein with HEPN domain
MPRDFRLYLQDIFDACRKIREYTLSRDFESFKADSRTFDAVLRNLEIIGEAVKNVPEEVRDRNPQIAWKKIAGLRIILAHAYFAVDIIDPAVGQAKPAGSVGIDDGERDRLPPAFVLCALQLRFDSAEPDP